MNTINDLSVERGVEIPGFNEPHSQAIRIWHWTFFGTITASLVTVLLASTIFRTRNTIALVQGPLQEKGATVSTDQARAVAHEYNDKFWMLHTYIGYVLCGLLLSRIIIEIAQPSEEKLRVKLKKALGFRPGNSSEKMERQHYIQVKGLYLVFYILIFTMALTGLGLAFEDAAILKGIQGTIKQVHSFVQYLIYGFILIHLAGVIKADLDKHQGLVSRMIHGKKGEV
ncbi:MAG TPA: cytochrome b/b6 domain-containing protein [Puia sp.]